MLHNIIVNENLGVWMSEKMSLERHHIDVIVISHKNYNLFELIIEKSSVLNGEFVSFVY